MPTLVPLAWRGVTGSSEDENRGANRSFMMPGGAEAVIPLSLVGALASVSTSGLRIEWAITTLKRGAATEGPGA